MNANLDKWTAALKSGDYKQTTGTLTASGKYCCLGLKILLEQGDCQSGDAYTLTNIENLARDFFVWLNDEVELTFNEIALVIDNVPESEWTIKGVSTLNIISGDYSTD